ncbi:hypothetical protein RLP65_001529 [Salmonella enterica]|nr:hypothetical protein [Salmonella enterica]EKZ8301897.1 hypothetical protein [Salmonella enterica]ELD8807712.1 hypothetical protein [Salmonella enterica]
MKFKFATLLTAATVFYSYQSVAQSQQSPDVWSVVEQKLQNAVPLNENTTFKSQAAWFELHRELFMYGPMSRADALLKKLDTQSNDAKFSLNHEASWIAENNSPDAAMVFLSKIGLDKPSSITAYESYVDGWVNRKQPEKALALLSKNADARNFYLATVLKSWHSDPDKTAAIYNENYADKIVVPYTQLKMLLIIAKQYHAKGDTAKALVYADSALKMFDTAIAQQPSAEAYRYQEYLDLMEIYYATGNKEKAMALSARLRKATGNKGSYFQYSLPGLLSFYKKNELTQNYQETLSTYVTQVDKIFNFAPSPRIEMELIDLLSKLDDVALMNKRIDLLMSAPEYTCYDDRYCYEYKIKALKNLFQHKQNAVAEKHIATLSAEAIYLSQAKAWPDEDMSRSFQRLAELYGYGNDTVNAKRVLHQHVPSLEEEAMIDHYMNAKQWSQARELMINADRVDNKNLMLLRQICSENTPECQEHITFTLKKLTTQASITRQDDTGNQQLYQIGNIFHRLGIIPGAEQQALIQALYNKAAEPKKATP